jgi:hypothetical protein
MGYLMFVTICTYIGMFVVFIRCVWLLVWFMFDILPKILKNILFGFVTTFVCFVVAGQIICQKLGIITKTES